LDAKTWLSSKTRRAQMEGAAERTANESRGWSGLADYP